MADRGKSGECDLTRISCVETLNELSMAALAAGTARSSRRKPTETHTAAFERYIGIDYFGAQTPTASLKGLRVYLADRTALPGEVLPPPGPREHWRRQCEERAKAKSVFHFDVQGAVAKSSHAGIPWLRYPYRQLGGRVHFWPFDDWAAPGVGRDGHRTHGSPTCGATETPRSHAGILGRGLRGNRSGCA